MEHLARARGRVLPGSRFPRWRVRFGLMLVGFVVAVVACSDPALGPTPTPRVVGPVPPEVRLEASADGSDTAEIVLGNEGEAPLTYTVDGVPEWIAGAGLEGTVAPGGTAVITLEASCTETRAGDTRSVTLSVHSDDPEQPAVDVPVTVTCEPADEPPPVASFAVSPQSGPAPLEVVLDARDSHATSGDVVAYAWDLGDGTSAEGATHTHTFEEAGTYRVTLRVRDEAGLEGTADAIVAVEPPEAVPPTARIEAAPASGTEQAPVKITFTADAEDPDGAVTNYDWTIAEQPYGGREVQHTFDAEGTYLVELVVTDDDGLSTRVREEYEVLAALYAVPEALAFDLGAPRPALSIESTGEWSLASAASWLDAQPASGGAGSTEVTLEVVSEGDLSGAEATATLTLDGTGGERVEVPVTLRLPDVGSIQGAPVALEASVGNEASAGFSVENAGTAPLVVSASSDQAWIDVAPGSDEAPAGGQASFDVTAQCGSVAETREGEIALSFDDPDEPSATVDVTLACEEASSESAFQIELIYYGDDTPSASQREVLQQAATNWTEAIIGDLPEVVLPEGSTPCGEDRPAYGGTVDDLVVFVSLVEMDGPGEILARAGPCWVRSSSELPFAGMLEVDIDDVDMLEDDGLLEDTAMHELGHVLGIGTLWVWGERDLVDPDCPSTHPESRFTGSEATDAHELEGGSGSPYVESDGDPGPQCGHWDEDRYGHELMTGFLNRDEALSRFTIGSLADLGYEVDYGAADAYSVGSLLQGADAGFELRDLLVEPSMFEPR